MIDVSNTNIIIDFSALGSNEIMQNLKVLFSTPAGTVALDRDFGIDWSILDNPINVAKTLLIVEYTEKVREYEPRVEVKEVTYTYDELNGKIIPKVVVGIVN